MSKINDLVKEVKLDKLDIKALKVLLTLSIPV